MTFGMSEKPGNSQSAEDPQNKDLKKQEEITKIEELDLSIEEIRAASNKLFNFFFQVICNPFFNFFIYLCIFGSTLPLALYTYDQTES